MPRKPPKNVVVITGASSPIGKALALEFAVRGDAVVVAATSEELLEEPKRACEMLGAWTHGVVVPERNPRAVQELAETAIERFGRIDIWVNHAAPYERVHGEEDVNGAALAAEMSIFEYGSRAALVVFGTQGNGVLMNIDGYSTVADVSDSARSAVRAQFSRIAEQGAKVQGVVVHSVISTPGVGVSEMAARVAELARSSARGDVLGKAAALLTMQRLRLWTGAKKARKRFERNEAAHTAVLAGMGNARSSSETESPRRRSGWHLTQARDTSERTAALMALVALPLVMAAVMLALVQV